MACREAMCWKTATGDFRDSLRGLFAKVLHEDPAQVCARSCAFAWGHQWLELVTPGCVAGPRTEFIAIGVPWFSSSEDDPTLWWTYQLTSSTWAATAWPHCCGFFARFCTGSKWENVGNLWKPTNLYLWESQRGVASQTRILIFPLVFPPVFPIKA